MVGPIALLLGLSLAGCGGDDGGDSTGNDSASSGAPESSTGSEESPGTAESSDAGETPSAAVEAVLPTALKKGYCSSLDIDAISAVLGVPVKKGELTTPAEGLEYCSAIHTAKQENRTTGFILSWRAEDPRPFAEIRQTLEASTPGCSFQDAPGFTPEQAFQMTACAKEDFRQESVFFKLESSGLLECRLFTNLPELAFSDGAKSLALCLEQLSVIA
jgi:hypothetical protein